MLTVAGRAAAVRRVRVGAVFTGVVLTVVRHTPCWLHVAAHTHARTHGLITIMMRIGCMWLDTQELDNANDEQHCSF